MRSPRLAAAVLPLVLAGAGCPSELADVCGLSPDVPAVETGRGTATRSDGEAFDEPATWSPGTNAAVNIGLLTLVVAKDQFGSDLDDLLGDNALPICVPQGERSTTSGSAALNDSPAFKTDAEHTGGVALLSFEDDVLVGRFEVELVGVESGESLAFTDGVFAATRLE